MWKKKLLIGVSVFTVIFSSISVSAAELSSNFVQPETTETENERNLEQITSIESEEENSLSDSDVATDITYSESDNHSSQDDTQQQPQFTDSVLPRVAGTWINEGGRWWFKYPNGTYPCNKWEEVNGIWYHFDSSGWMETEKWIQDGGKWYYVNSSGAMVVENWMLLGGKWYYFDAHGAMVTGWQILGGKWYYFNASGAMLSSTTQYIGNKYYSFDGNGIWVGTQLSVSRKEQQKTQWCWVACAEMISKYKYPSSPYSQADVVKMIKGTNSDGSAPNKTGTGWDMATAIRKFTENNYDAGWKLFQESTVGMKGYIDADNPLILCIKWEGVFDFHAIVCAGYQNDRVKIIDPWQNTTTKYYDYDSLWDGTMISGAKGKYINTVALR